MKRFFKSCTAFLAVVMLCTTLPFAKVSAAATDLSLEFDVRDSTLRSVLRGYDSDGNGTLDADEIANITNLTLSGVAKLQGIYKLTSLEVLDISACQGVIGPQSWNPNIIDLSYFPHIQKVSLDDNQWQLNVTNCEELRFIYCEGTINFTNDNFTTAGYLSALIYAYSTGNENAHYDGSTADRKRWYYVDPYTGETIMEIFAGSMSYSLGTGRTSNFPYVPGFNENVPTPTTKPTATSTPLVTNTPRPTVTATSTPMVTNTPMPTSTPMPTATPRPTNTPKPTATNTPVPTNTVAPTATNTPRPTNTVAPTATNTPRPTNTVAPTATSTPKPTNTVAPTATNTPVPTNTVAPTATNTPRPTNTVAPTATNTPRPTNTVAPTATSTPRPTNTVAPTATSTPRPTNTIAPTATNTPRPTNTVAPTATNTPRPTNTIAPTATSTPRPTNTVAPTATNTPVPTNIVAPTATNTPRPTNTIAPTATSTPRPTNTVAPTATSTPRPTNTIAPTATSTPRPTNTIAPTATSTPRPTNTVAPTATNTPVPTNTVAPVATSTPVPTVLGSVDVAFNCWGSTGNVVISNGQNLAGGNVVIVLSTDGTALSFNVWSSSVTVVSSENRISIVVPVSLITGSQSTGFGITSSSNINKVEFVSANQGMDDITVNLTGNITVATPTPAPTNTVAPTATSTPVPTNTVAPTVTSTPVPTNTVVPTATSTPVPTNTVAPTATSTPVPTNTVAPTTTSTPVPTNTVAPTATSTPVPTNTVAPTVTSTPVPTNTVAPTATSTPVPTTPATGVRAFCERLYTCALNRTAEPAGVDYWESSILEGISGADAAKVFFFGPEFVNSNVSDSEFIVRLYKTFLDRTPSSAELDYWVSVIGNSSREFVFNSFVNSNEWNVICSYYGIKSGSYDSIRNFVKRLYVECLGRNASDADIAYWTEVLASGQVTGSMVAYQFVYSNEFQSSITDNATYITRMYATFFGRDVASAEIAYWVDAMNQGMSRDVVFSNFVYSSEYQTMCINAGINP